MRMVSLCIQINVEISSFWVFFALSKDGPYFSQSLLNSGLNNLSSKNVSLIYLVLQMTSFVFHFNKKTMSCYIDLDLQMIELSPMPVINLVPFLSWWHLSFTPVLVLQNIVQHEGIFTNCKPCSTLVLQIMTFVFQPNYKPCLAKHCPAEGHNCQFTPCPTLVLQMMAHVAHPSYKLCPIKTLSSMMSLVFHPNCLSNNGTWFS